jgi:hypothetical protein
MRFMVSWRNAKGISQFFSTVFQSTFRSNQNCGLEGQSTDAARAKNRSNASDTCVRGTARGDATRYNLNQWISGPASGFRVHHLFLKLFSTDISENPQRYAI